MRLRLFPILACALFLASCSKKGGDPGELDSGPAPKPPPPAEAAKREEPPKYFYPYAQKRDPFEPLVGPGAFYARSGQDRRGGSGEMVNLELKGILVDRRGKVAMISSQDGETYTLRSGRVYDKKNRVVSGVSGVIKENSVILITQNRAVKEIMLKKGPPEPWRSTR